MSKLDSSSSKEVDTVQSLRSQKQNLKLFLKNVWTITEKIKKKRGQGSSFRVYEMERLLAILTGQNAVYMVKVSIYWYLTDRFWCIYSSIYGDSFISKYIWLSVKQLFIKGYEVNRTLKAGICLDSITSWKEKYFI